MILRTNMKKRQKMIDAGGESGKFALFKIAFVLGLAYIFYLGSQKSKLSVRSPDKNEMNEKTSWAIDKYTRNNNYRV